MERGSNIIRLAGLNGSIFGIITGIILLVNWSAISMILNLYALEIFLCILWLIVQGCAFFAIYRERNESVSLVAFIFSIISALIEAVVLIIVVTLPYITNSTEALGALYLTVLAVFFGTITEASYLIFAGITIIQLTRQIVKETIGFVTGIAFVLTGCVYIVVLVGMPAILLPFSIIVTNLLACFLFTDPTNIEYQQYNETALHSRGHRMDYVEGPSISSTYQGSSISFCPTCGRARTSPDARYCGYCSASYPD